MVEEVGLDHAVILQWINLAKDLLRSESELFEEEVSCGLLLSTLCLLISDNNRSTSKDIVDLTYLSSRIFLISFLAMALDSGVSIFSSVAEVLKSRSSLTKKRVASRWL